MSKLQQLDALLEKAALYSKFIDGELRRDTYAVPGEGDDAKPALLSYGELKGYQVKGLNWLIQLYENGMNGILADEMGLGKTIQTVAFLAHLWSKGVQGPFLVVAPLSTLANWVAEVSRWAPSLPVLLYHGSKPDRLALQTRILNGENAEEGDRPGKKRRVEGSGRGAMPIVVTSYEVAVNDSAFLSRLTWKQLIVDEAHRLKNFNCRLIRELRTLRTENRLLLTGTPLQNNLTELWSLLNFILPDIFDSLENFQSWFDFETFLGQEVAGVPSRLELLVTKLHTIIRPFMLRRLKRQVAGTSIARKMEVLLYCPLLPAQKAFYDAFLRRDVGALKGGGGRLRLLNTLMQLRKVCNSPLLFDQTFLAFLRAAIPPALEEETPLPVPPPSVPLGKRRRAEVQYVEDGGQDLAYILANPRLLETLPLRDALPEAPGITVPATLGWLRAERTALTVRLAEVAASEGHEGDPSTALDEIAAAWNTLPDSQRTLYGRQALAEEQRAHQAALDGAEAEGDVDSLSAEEFTRLLLETSGKARIPFCG